jgi:hypothetical protein
MADTELELTLAGDKAHARRSGGGTANGASRLSALDRDLINLLDRLVREKRLSRHDEFETFGALLYEALFGEIDGFLRSSLQIPTGEDRLRLQLVFDEASYAFARFPWEFLYANGRGTRESFFLATHPKLILSRYLPMYENRPDPPAAAKPLRFLVIISRPKDPTLGTVVASPVADAIKSLEEPGSIEVQILENEPLEAVLTAVEKGCRPHIIHYIGHGMYDEEKNEGQLAFVGDDGTTTQWIPEETFASFFDAWKPHLVFLQACEGAAADFANNFAGLAPKLMGKNIPAVVAMQYPVSNGLATNFSLAFYKELMQGTPYDHAVQSGRRRILLLNPKALDTRDFAAPVLYMRSRDGRLWPQATEVK